MGKGKGSVSFWMTRIRPGSILFELQCSLPSLAKIAFAVAQSKLPFHTKFISK
jgi:large subunit ribosomal protein L16